MWYTLDEFQYEIVERKIGCTHDFRNSAPTMANSSDKSPKPIIPPTQSLHETSDRYRLTMEVHLQGPITGLAQIEVSYINAEVRTIK